MLSAAGGLGAHMFDALLADEALRALMVAVVATVPADDAFVPANALAYELHWLLVDYYVQSGVNTCLQTTWKTVRERLRHRGAITAAASLRTQLAVESAVFRAKAAWVAPEGDGGGGGAAGAAVAEEEAEEAEEEAEEEEDAEEEEAEEAEEEAEEEEEVDADDDCYDDGDEAGGGGKRRAPRRRTATSSEYRRMDMGLRSRVRLPAPLGKRAPRWQTAPELVQEPYTLVSAASIK